MTDFLRMTYLHLKSLEVRTCDDICPPGWAAPQNEGEFTINAIGKCKFQDQVTDDMAVLNNSLTIVLEALKNQESQKEKDSAFKIEIEYTGTFETSAATKERYEKTDQQEYQAFFNERLANRMYPTVRTILMNIVSQMGIGQIPLPFHLESERTN